MNWRKLTSHWGRFWKKHRCMAISASTKVQCGREIRGFRKYCWQHIPKAPLVVSALLGLLAKEGFHLIFPSSEQRETQKSREVILDRMAVASELSSDISHLNVVLAFNQPIIPKLATEMRLLVSLTKDDEFRERSIEVLGTVTHLGKSNSINESALSMMFLSKSQTENLTNSNNLGYNAVEWYPLTSELPLPIAVGPDGVRPFALVREMEGYHVQVFLPVQLAAAVERVDVVVNSSPGLNRRLKLFSRRVSPTDWTEVDYDVRLRFWRRGKEERQKMCTLKDAKISDSWSINLQDAKWEIHSPPPFSEGFRFPYQ